MTWIKNKKIQKTFKIIQKIKNNKKLTRGINFRIVWSKLMTRTKLNHYYRNKNQVNTTKN